MTCQKVHKQGSDDIKASINIQRPIPISFSHICLDTGLGTLQNHNYQYKVRFLSQLPAWSTIIAISVLVSH